MNKKAVIAKISARSGVKKSEISKVFDALYFVILSELRKGEEINFSGVGKLFTHERPERKYISFQTGETFVAPSRLVPSVKFSKHFIEKF